MKSTDQTRYVLAMIKEATMEDENMALTFYGTPCSKITIKAPDQQDIETFVPGRLIIVAQKGLDEIVALAEVQIGHTRVDPRFSIPLKDGKISIEPPIHY